MRYLAYMIWALSFLFLAKAACGQTLEEAFDLIALQNDMMGGSVVVFCEDGIIEEIAIGTADWGREIEITTESKYRIASISKTVTAIAVMQLVERGLLNLDEDIGGVLGYSVRNPFSPFTSITARMLLSHTSTIIDGLLYPDFLAATVSGDTIPDLKELLVPGGAYYTASQYNATAPGLYFNYSNINYGILGTLIEKVSGMRFDVYCQQYISVPLGLDASFNVLDLEDIDQVAVLYRKLSGEWVPQADNYLGVQPEFANIEGYVPGANGMRFGPQGSFRSSANDVARLFLLLMNGGIWDGVRLLSEESSAMMLGVEWNYDGDNGNTLSGLFLSWGLGIHRITSTAGSDIVLPGSEEMSGHAGEAFGLVSDVFFDSERKAGFVFLTNGVGQGYHLDDNSAFYTVEQEVFGAIEEYGGIVRCSEATSTIDLELSDLRLFPNPTRGFFHIESDNWDVAGCLLNVYASDGRVVWQQELAERSVSLDLSPYLQPGVYVVEVTVDRRGVWREKILIW